MLDAPELSQLVKTIKIIEESVTSKHINSNVKSISCKKFGILVGEQELDIRLLR